MENRAKPMFYSVLFNKCHHRIAFLISTYEIWKVLVSLAKKNFFFIANFHVLGLFIPKK
jgi:hypothetical protein